MNMRKHSTLVEVPNGYEIADEEIGPPMYYNHNRSMEINVRLLLKKAEQWRAATIEDIDKNMTCRLSPLQTKKHKLVGWVRYKDTEPTWRVVSDAGDCFIWETCEVLDSVG